MEGFRLSSAVLLLVVGVAAGHGDTGSSESKSVVLVQLVISMSVLGHTDSKTHPRRKRGVL